MKRRSILRCGIWLALSVIATSGAPGAGTNDSPLMQAVLHRDGAAMMKLLAGHADVKQTNGAGATALHFAVDDLGAVQALLAAGADPNAADQDGVTPLALAAGRQDAGPIVLAMLAHGGDAKKVGAEMGGADPKALAALLKAGANPRAHGALHAAASLGLTENLRMLLDAGADIDQRAPPLGTTPLTWAVEMGQVEAVKLLLNRGADPDLQETFNAETALMQAAASDRPGDIPEQIVQALLAHGADVKLRDDEGANAETWALRAGAQKIAALLVAHGSPSGALVTWSAKGAHVPATNTIEQAVARAVPIIEAGRVDFRKIAHCSSCHQDALPALALEIAQQRGFSIDAKARTYQAQLTAGTLAPQRDSYRLGIGFPDIAEAAYLLCGLAASGYPPDSVTESVVRYLLLQQAPDGSWRATLERVPSDGSDVAVTAMSIRALAAYARLPNTIAHARDWLARVSADNNEDLTFQILGLHWAGASTAEVAPLTAKLLARQREDGGFAQRDGMTSDAYATSEAIVALRDAGGLAATNPAMAKAVHFLLTDQMADGSWFVATRALRFQPFFDSGFPQGRSQYMSATATAWAVMALAGEGGKPQQP